MAFKNILVHLDTSRRNGANVSLAAQWAKAHSSHIVGLVPTGLYDGVIAASAIAPGVPDFIAESADFLRQRAERIGREFRQQLGDAVPHELRVVDMVAVDAVVRHGRTSDLVVVGQHDPQDPDSPSVLGDLPQRILMETGCPLLVVPYAGRFDKVPQNIVLAWDGSREASVAVRHALPALGLARSVTVLTFGSADQEDDGHLLAPQLLTYLARHGVTATARHEVADIAVGDALLSRLSDIGADLLVMGGYAHSRLRELVLGGATRRILASMTVPVLMAH